MNSLDNNKKNFDHSVLWNVHPEAFNVRIPEKQKLAEKIMFDIYKNIRSIHRKDLNTQDFDSIEKD